MLAESISTFPFSNFLSFASRKNIPNGKVELTRANRNNPLDQRLAVPTRTIIKIKAINRRPCSMPTTLTTLGSPPIYLIGIAMKSRISREIPSTKLKILRNFCEVGELKSFISRGYSGSRIKAQIVEVHSAGISQQGPRDAQSNKLVPNIAIFWSIK